jgi:hypothetical protein
MAQLSTLARFTLSGEILSEDTLAALTQTKCDIPGASMDNDTAKESRFDESEFTVAYELLADLWQKIRLDVPAYDRRKLREKWQKEVMEMLGHDIKHYRDTMPDGSPIPFNYRTEQIPLYLGIYSTEYDVRDENARRRRTRHELFQAYLDATDEDAWGVLFNGRFLRLLSDYHKSLTRNYVEADLEAIFDALDVDAFRAVWRIFHGSRFTPSGKGVRPIEMLRDASRQQGASIGKELRRQVRDAIEIIGNGFLVSDRSGDLRATLGNNPRECHEFYRALLIIIYRLLFLLFIENRQSWTPVDNPVWRESYSISRLRERAEVNSFLSEEGEDYWEGLKVVFRIIREGNEFFGIHPYGGELFNDERLGVIRDSILANSTLLEALRKLTLFERNKTVQRVNFTHLDLEALGSVYEGLLDVTVTVDGQGNFAFAPGTDRKLSGSYFTPRPLILELIESALKPVIEERVQKAVQAEKEAALLNIKVVDPSCGSGSFLVEACDALTAKLVEIRLNGAMPDDLELRRARRDVVRKCIHGVDVNPLAVDLCRFVLWLHVAHPQFPLSYLEPLIKNGNALVGVPLLSQVEESREIINIERAKLLAENNKRKAATTVYNGWQDSIPDGAFDAVTGDDKNTAKLAKRENKEQRGGQLTTAAIPAINTREEERNVRAKFYSELRNKSDETPDAIEKAVAAYGNYIQSEAYCHEKRQADLWCAAFYQRFSPSTPPITHQWFRLADNDSRQVSDKIWAEVSRLNDEIRFFHWALEFPDVFKEGGFDCVLGNPPWERIRLEEQDFFASLSPEISATRGKSRRRTLINNLLREQPNLATDLENAKGLSEAHSRFFRNSERYTLSAIGDLNTYPLFAETVERITSKDGCAGVVLPASLATDDTLKTLFAYLIKGQRIKSFFGFINSKKIFPDIKDYIQFALLTLGKSPSPRFAFRLTKVDDVRNKIRTFDLQKEELTLVNPNTLTCPVFLTRSDADLVKSIYKRVPIFIHEKLGKNPWGATFTRMFDMTNDDANGFFFDSPSEGRLPLYEAKMIWNFDHRFSTYEGATQSNINEGNLPQTTAEQKSNFNFRILPESWVDQKEALRRVKANEHQWIMGYRLVAPSTNERTAICSLMPMCGAGHSLAIFDNWQLGSLFACLLLANFNSLIFEYNMRQKLGGSNISYFVVKQLPILPPWAYHDSDKEYISSRVLELVYTSWDMQPFALEMGYTGEPFKWEEERRSKLRAELDAYFARLYGLTRKQVRYILDPHGLSDRELKDILDIWEEPTCSGPNLLPDHPTTSFPGETFRVLKKNEIDRYGEFRTRRLVLEAWDRLETEYGSSPVTDYHKIPAGWTMQFSDESIDVSTVHIKNKKEGNVEELPQLTMF